MIDQPFSVGIAHILRIFSAMRSRTTLCRTQNFQPKKSVIACIFFAICIAGDANFHATPKSTPRTGSFSAAGTGNAGISRFEPTKLSLAN
ncbi:hypothetical protein ASC71_10775 [Rhizobium sp. Root1240]|nr:hypothetical protein ASC71_10775 [Rhizobium sp. Root1240]